MTDSPIKVVNNLLPYDCFRKLAFFIMTIDSYRCHDYTVYETESDGSINFYGEQNLNPKTGMPNETKFHEILFSTRLLFRDHNAEYLQDLYHHLHLFVYYHNLVYHLSKLLEALHCYEFFHMLV